MRFSRPLAVYVIPQLGFTSTSSAAGATSPQRINQPETATRFRRTRLFTRLFLGFYCLLTDFKFILSLVFSSLSLLNIQRKYLWLVSGSFWPAVQKNKNYINMWKQYFHYGQKKCEAQQDLSGSRLDVLSFCRLMRFRGKHLCWSLLINDGRDSDVSRLKVSLTTRGHRGRGEMHWFRPRPGNYTAATAYVFCIVKYNAYVWYIVYGPFINLCVY